MHYLKGKHIVASLKSVSSEMIKDYVTCKKFIDLLIEKYQLKNLGEVYHNFLPQGFTAVVCLSESHISIHTWPEHNLINLDIYLSNFERVNDNTVENIFNDLVLFFNADILEKQTLMR